MYAIYIKHFIIRAENLITGIPTSEWVSNGEMERTVAPPAGMQQWPWFGSGGWIVSFHP